MTGWYLFSFFMIAIFCQDLRALLIIPRMEEPIDKFSQIDFAATKIALTFGDGAMLTETSIQLLTTLYPVYAPFKTQFRVLNRESSHFSNVPDLTNRDIFDLAKDDVNTDGSIIQGVPELMDN